MRQTFNPDNGLTQQEQDDLMMHLSKAAILLKKYAVSLSSDEKRGRRTVGKRREAYVRQVLRAGKAHEGILPRNLDLLQFEKSLLCLEQNKDIQLKLNELAELAADTHSAIGQELMGYTDTVYGAFKLSQIRDAGLDSVMAELEDFHRRSAQEEEE